MTRLLHALSFLSFLILTTSVLAQTKAPAGAAGKTSPRPAGNLSPIIEPGSAAPGPASSGSAAPGPTAQAALPPLPQQPEWSVRMSPEEQKWVDDVLRYWESRSDK